jgi:hypothetical protein
MPYSNFELPIEVNYFLALGQILVLTRTVPTISIHTDRLVPTLRLYSFNNSSRTASFAIRLGDLPGPKAVRPASIARRDRSSREVRRDRSSRERSEIIRPASGARLGRLFSLIAHPA